MSKRIKLGEDLWGEIFESAEELHQRQADHERAFREEAEEFIRERDRIKRFGENFSKADDLSEEEKRKLMEWRNEEIELIKELENKDKSESKE